MALPKLNLPKFFIPELLATFLFAYFVQSFPPIWNTQSSFLQPMGNAIMIYIIILLTHTKAVVHFNPAVTLSFILAGKISFLDGAFYVVAQIVGGLLGSGVCFLGRKGVVDDSLEDSLIIKTYSMDVPDNAKILPIIISEIITTTCLCLLCLLATFNKQTWTDKTTALAIGMSVFLGITVGSTYQAGCLNPLRTLLPWFCNPARLIENWPYVVGPLVGGIVAAGLWLVEFRERGRERVNIEKRDMEGAGLME